MTRSEARKQRTALKHERIRELYEKNYTNQRRVNGAKIYTKEYIMAKLSEEFFLSIRQIENIIYTKPITLIMPVPAASDEAAGTVQALAA
jgi:uncharacterized protein YqiB (DUF1249 family)